LHCLLAIQLFASGRAEYYDTTPVLLFTASILHRAQFRQERVRAGHALGVHHNPRPCIATPVEGDGSFTSDHFQEAVGEEEGRALVLAPRSPRA
jgi:hypothetical protein